MAIIGTLLTIAVPRYFRTLEHARETVLRQDLAILREAIDKHYADLSQYPDTPGRAGRQALRALRAGRSIHQGRRQLDARCLRTIPITRASATSTAAPRATAPTALPLASW